MNRPASLRPIALGAFALLAFCLGGCGLQSGQTIVKYERGKPPRVVKALDDGRYALYSSTDATPDVTYYVEKGDPIGFRKMSGGDNTIEAVAGDNPPVELSKEMARNYYWKYRK
ncbi:MAG TPA: hypothetical protein VFB66_32145 [Tepidisphaeraceae bacterium]|nr:hypothetical protein [Tepidisphaeraceae bacterium]